LAQIARHLARVATAALHGRALDGGGSANATAVAPKVHQQSWTTVSEKKLKIHFEKTREIAHEWGCGAARVWHLRAKLLQFLQQLATPSHTRLLEAALAAAQPLEVPLRN
jgi:hypothetical protein